MPKLPPLKELLSPLMNEPKDYHLYILLCDGDVLYTGIALDPGARLKQHQQGQPYGAKFTRKFNQLEIVYQVNVGDKIMAHRLEYRIKKWPRKKKLQLIEDQLSKNAVLVAAGLECE